MSSENVSMETPCQDPPWNPWGVEIFVDKQLFKRPVYEVHLSEQDIIMTAPLI